MNSSLERILTGFTIEDHNSLRDSGSRIIALKSRENSKKYFLKLSAIADSAKDIYILNFKKIEGLRDPNLVFHHSITVLEKPHFEYNVAEIVERASYGTLIDYLKSNIKYSQVVEVFLQTFMGFQFLHQNGLLHRDVKPTNIFIHEVNGCHIAKIGDVEFWQQSNEMDTRTTPEYLAPEVDRYVDYTIKAEFWAIGVMLYELFTGKYPFGSRLDGLSIAEIRQKTKQGFIEGIDRIPPPFNEIVKYCLQLDIRDRPESMESLIDIMGSVKVG